MDTDSSCFAEWTPKVVGKILLVLKFEKDYVDSDSVEGLSREDQLEYPLLVSSVFLLRQQRAQFRVQLQTDQVPLLEGEKPDGPELLEPGLPPEVLHPQRLQRVGLVLRVEEQGVPLLTQQPFVLPEAREEPDRLELFVRGVVLP